MKSVHRMVGQALGRLAGRLSSIETDRLLGAVMALGAVAAVVIVALGGFLTGITESFLASLLYAFALVLPAAGFLLVAFVVRRQLRAEPHPREPIRTPPPEEGVTQAEWSVGRDARHKLMGATASQYRCESHISAEKIHNRLRRSAVQRTRTRHGHDEATARSMVAGGEWTDDPVAAAFLSEEVRYPFGDRLRAAIDPGSAYRRRVRRTLDAIERLDEGALDGRSAAEQSPAADESGSVSEGTGSEAVRTGDPSSGGPPADDGAGRASRPGSEAAGATGAPVSEVTE